MICPLCKRKVLECVCFDADDDLLIEHGRNNDDDEAEGEEE